MGAVASCGPRAIECRAPTYRWCQQLATALLLGLTATLARAECIDAVAVAVSIQGTVSVQRTGSASWNSLVLGEGICIEDTVRVAASSRAVLRLQDHTTLPLDEDSVLRIAAPETPESWWLELVRGAVHIISRVPRELGVRTPFVNAAVEGTEFYVRSGDDGAEIRVFDGAVRVGEGDQGLLIGSGQAVIAGPDGVPRPVQVLQPRNAVQWALYYPPIVDLRAERVAAMDEAEKSAVRAYRRGDVPGALAALAEVPESERDGNWAILRAAMLLTVGQAEQARVGLASVAAEDPAWGDALAVQSLIALVTGDTVSAGELAQQAVDVAPRSPSPWIVLGYVEQARFDLPAARESTAQATRLAPTDPLAWARLAELEQALGDLQASRAAAQRAEAIDAELSRTQTVLGFARLTQMEAAAAATAFRDAIRLDSADPLPRLGLGLAHIRRGDLAEGRGQIEIATSLDPNGSLIRSYLGKAYYEEKRESLAGSELRIAKMLDPNDPTPWLYDAIRKQTENRPVEALKDLQRSIELNDNRAIYRSKLLLDQDLATRATSLARIYDQLGFSQLAVHEASKSLALDPGNWSAHRFLGESYQGRQRVDVARTSELLQAQLRQPLNLYPVQPELLESGLNIGPSAALTNPAFNDYTALFEQDGFAFSGAAVAGNHDTFGTQFALTALQSQFSLSLGYLDYSTDGFRENNDLSNEVVDALVHVRPTPALSVHLNYRQRDSDEGDLRMRFTDDPSDLLGREIDRRSSRFGFSYEIDPSANLIFSYANVNRDEQLETVFRQGPNVGLRTDLDSVAGTDLQVQYLLQRPSSSFLVGASRYSGDGDIETRITTSDGSDLLATADQSLETSYDQVYGYGFFQLGPDTLLTAGLSYDQFEDSIDGVPVEIEKTNPKLGFQAALSDRMSIRLAAARSVKRAVTFEETLEPTEIVGFNQLYDDFTGTRSELYGLGLDAKLGAEWEAGVEATRRNLSVPRFFQEFGAVTPRDDFLEVDFNTAEEDEDQREDRVRLYSYWTFGQRWSLSAEYEYEQFERTPAQWTGNLGRQVAETDLPERIVTRSFPVALQYFHPSGFFGSAVATFVEQEVDYVSDLARQGRESEDDFWLFDVGIGYRLPKRAGIVSFEIRNLFDEEFLYHDVNIQTAKPIGAPFVPDRTMLGRVVIQF